MIGNRLLGAARAQRRGQRRTAVFCVALLASTIAVGTLASVAALALPEGRVIEMVSPIYKGGYGVGSVAAVAPNGESVAFESQGAFAGAPASPALNGYIARRGPAGWTTAPLMPPAAIAPAVPGTAPLDYSSTLESVVAYAQLGPNAGAADYANDESAMWLHDTSLADTVPNWELGGKLLKSVDELPFAAVYVGGSADFSHIALFTRGDERLLPEASASQKSLYDLVTRGLAAGSLRLVGVNDRGEPIDPDCPVYLGGSELQGVEPGLVFNAVSADGEEIFFTTNPNASPQGCDGFGGTTDPSNPALLYVRVAGAQTLQVSAPLTASCEPSAPCAKAAPARAEFIGANSAGSEVYFMTTQPLVSEDTDQQRDLYLARIGCPGGEACQPAQRVVTSLVDVSHAATAGEPAEVQGVVSVSQDGSHVYFVAHGVLGTGPNAEGQAPVKGADNLYVYDSETAQAPVFIAELCTGPEVSGGAKDARCPDSLESAGEHNDSVMLKGSEEQTTADGRFLLFGTYARLLASDTDSARDVYRYDAATGLLDRVSSGEGGFDADGNNSAFGALVGTGGFGGGSGSLAPDHVAQQSDLVGRQISEDGSRVVFESAEPLAADAARGQENAYEWHKEPGWQEGVVSLIAPLGQAGEVEISHSGDDVFFTTPLGLLPQDTDGQRDLYDARLDSLPPPVAAETECSADACQGPLTNPAPLLVAGSISQAPGENLPPVIATKAKQKAKSKAKPKKKRRKRPSKKHGKAKKRSGRGKS